MLTGQRKQLILEILHRQGQVVAKDLSREWQVSEDTIRRDLRELAAEGRLQRVHGGALPSSPAVADFHGREALSPISKEALGQAAAALVQPGQIVAIDGGTTNAQLVRHLPRDLRATIVTHSPTIAAALIDFPFLEVILIGGRLFRHSMVAVGASTVEEIDKIRTDLFFMGATGIHPEAGVTTGDWEEAQVKRAFCRQAAETLILVSPEKLNAASPFLIVPLTDIHGLVVDRDVPETVLDPFRAAGLSVIRG